MFDNFYFIYIYSVCVCVCVCVCLSVYKETSLVIQELPLSCARICSGVKNAGKWTAGGHVL